MGIFDEEKDRTNTLQTYLTKYPLLKDSANTGGTQKICAFNGTWAVNCEVSGWKFKTNA